MISLLFSDGCQVRVSRVNDKIDSTFAELFNTVVKWKRETRERLTFHYFVQLMSGVKYLHDVGYAHRDLKLENLLLSKDGVLKIADFGVSKKLKFNPMKTCCGSPDYIAPGASTASTSE